ncbi:unnamed protein product [Nezara viridula]|uniref:Neuropeptide n=1 Tax=Nezara viridula TaxID=85310 RepID=A0A9P0MKM0_NEZVI|nr:unnamed protein product [Nezara viridula]
MRTWVILLSIAVLFEAVTSASLPDYEYDTSEEYHEIEHEVATHTHSKVSKTSSTVVKKEVAKHEITFQVPEIVAVTTTTKAPPVTVARFSRRKKSPTNGRT